MMQFGFSARGLQFFILDKQDDYEKTGFGQTILCLLPIML
ncbi:hypothetical protein XCR1_1590012 [Xenorhabdus cabanillasii JM26]|uniref:Uncharacterized protein n=1 Tax=Xenorhabdus cabanillasii JM26 TaxID=1427517 RepID=W1IV00_9GAMM|nr:hypothetical protein Xcab_01894 [Xenorhabdus cabanillasii JM26]CDL81421.1 hypothetical protein XCR1_1590012 [Xenorhabdus cabanillasii JM26]